MNNDSMNYASIEKTAGALIFQLCTAMANDFDTARSRGCGELLLAATAFVTRVHRVM